MLSQTIDLDLLRQLRDREFRAGFFQAEVENTIPEKIKALRKLRNMKQTDLAAASGMKQTAVSRIEKPTYGCWNVTTLLRVAEALDARLIVTLEPSEAFLARFEAEEAKEKPPVGISDNEFAQPHDKRPSALDAFDRNDGQAGRDFNSEDRSKVGLQADR